MKKFIFVVPLMAISLLVSCNKGGGDKPGPDEETYTITWVNYNDEVLEVDENVKKGDMPHYDGETPSKPDEGIYKYCFDGWDSEITPVTESKTYKAVLNPSYTTMVVSEGHLYLQVTSDDENAKIHWGDGAEEPIREWNDHGYSAPGDYEVILDNITSLYVQSYGNNCVKGAHLGSYNTSIADSAFSSCVNLTSIYIPHSVTSIGNNAFSTCSSLESINIPNSVTSIGNTAFSFCTSFTSINIPNSVTSIGDGAFIACTSLASIDIPNSVASIGSGAFQDCPFTSITIPNSVTSIGANAFKPFTPNTLPSQLTSVTFLDGPNSVSIGEGAFQDCPLTSITFPNSVTSIGKNAFKPYDSSKFPSQLTSVTFLDGPNSVSIGESAFSTCPLTSITIPNSVNTIGPNAFNGCSKLKTVTLLEGSNPTTIGESAFSSCPITSITIPNRVTKIGASAFKNCTQLAKVTFGANSKLTVIGDSAFYGCPIDSINIPSGVTSIGINAFSYTNITSVTIPSGVTTLTGFGQTKLKSITIPSSVTSIGNNAFYGCDQLEKVEFEGGGPNLTSIDAYAFGECSFTSFTIPSSVTSIGTALGFSDGCAFQGCESLTSIKIPSNATLIGGYNFQGCKKLEEVIFENGGPKITALMDSTFSGCKAITKITIPSTVTIIDDNVFRFCDSLESVNIPHSVTEIGMNVFGADTKLAKIDLTSFTTSDEVPTNESTFIGTPTFEVASKAVAEKFVANSSKGWPGSLDSYSWPDKSNSSI